ncbi:MAG: signal peptidase I [Anaerolineae bacterium]|nr:signal peptidase I [Anaerolineae bacterium]MDW8099056.1 signal peptidase I [Anaerolineae bacterium]
MLRPLKGTNGDRVEKTEFEPELNTAFKAQIDQLPAELLASGRALTVRVRGYSMFPWLRPGDLVRVEPVDVMTLHPGDVILFRAGNLAITHRLLRWKDGFLITKGDAAPCPDRPLSPAEVAGRVVEVRRGGRAWRLDRGWRRTLAPVQAALSPWTPPLYAIVRRLRRVLSRKG